jgi:acetylornithine deacetylase/succinyl-diaminopimelate desuccinylase-like protein
MAFDKSLERYIGENFPDNFVRQLSGLVEIRSVSSFPHPEEIMEEVLNRAGLVGHMFGFKSSLCNPSTKTPTLVLESRWESDPDALDVLLYNHMDIQPVEPEHWDTDPFKPVVKDGRIYGRGTTDDKGPALATLHALNFLRQQEGVKLPRVRVVYETAEEIGSTGFDQFLDSYPKLVGKPDVIVVSDTIFMGENPTISYKLRGLAMAELELITGRSPAHSGMWGGVVDNPLVTLSRVASSLVSKDGFPEVHGFMQAASPLTEREIAELGKAGLALDVNKFREDSGWARLYSREGRDLLSRTQHAPAIEVHNYGGLPPYAQISTSIPNTIKLRISMRLVPGQDPDEMIGLLEKHVKAEDDRIKVNKLEGLPATVATDLENRYVGAAQEACEYGFGKPPVFVGCGGSILALHYLKERFSDAPQVLVAQSLEADNYHGHNESFSLDQARGGVKTMAHYFRKLGEMKKAA